MTDGQAFIDYYDILQVRPDCDAKALESAYHSLAKTHHPDHTGSEESTKFNEVTAAFRILRDPKMRAQYDNLYANHHRKEWFEFRDANEIGVDEQAARAPELGPGVEKVAFLVEDLDAIVVAIGDEQPTARVHR